MNFTVGSVYSNGFLEVIIDRVEGQDVKIYIEDVTDILHDLEISLVTPVSWMSQKKLHKLLKKHNFSLL